MTYNCNRTNNMFCFQREKCSFCQKRKFKLYEIPIYSDLHSLFCSMTQDSYMTCWKCIYKLVQKQIIVVSLKTIIKESVIKDLSKQDISDITLKNMNNLQEVLASESEYHNHMNYLTNEENAIIKDLKNKIKTTSMC